MRIGILLYCLFFLIGPLWAQKKTANIIPQDAIRKVEHARKLYNRLKIFEGEKILKELVKANPNDCYYRDALLQMQRQVLRYVKTAQGEVEAMNPGHLEIDSSMTEAEKDSVKGVMEIQDMEQKNEENGLMPSGLDRSGIHAIAKKEEENETPLTDAVVTIDSSLIKPQLDENGDTIRRLTREEKAMKKQLKHLTDLAQIPYEGYESDFIANARKSTLELNCLDSACYYLREFMVDTLPIDIDVTEASEEAYLNALADLKERNYLAASKQLEKAISVSPDYFHARLKLAEVFYSMNKDSLAFEHLKYLMVHNTDRPEPFEKAANHFYQKGDYEKALVSIIDAITVYPNYDYFRFLELVSIKKGVELNTQWIKREVYPLSNASSFEEIIAEPKTPWWQYQAVKQEIHDKYDSLGIALPKVRASEPYMEIYAWKRMLNNTSREYFPFARAMDKIGYLDCYIFITQFHQDIYSQFKDWAPKNRERINKYFFLLINWQSKKFEKLRLEFFPEKKDDIKKK